MLKNQSSNITCDFEHLEPPNPLKNTRNQTNSGVNKKNEKEPKENILQELQTGRRSTNERTKLFNQIHRHTITSL